LLLRAARLYDQLPFALLIHGDPVPPTTLHCGLTTVKD
jgi:hypothetical protein